MVRFCPTLTLSYYTLGSMFGKLTDFWCFLRSNGCSSILGRLQKLMSCRHTRSGYMESFVKISLVVHEIFCQNYRKYKKTWAKNPTNVSFSQTTCLLIDQVSRFCLVQVCCWTPSTFWFYVFVAVFCIDPSSRLKLDLHCSASWHFLIPLRYEEMASWKHFASSNLLQLPSFFFSGVPRGSSDVPMLLLLFRRDCF